MMSGEYFFIDLKRKSTPPRRDGEIELLTTSSARTILTRACTRSLTIAVSHNKIGEEIKYPWHITYTSGIGILFIYKKKANNCFTILC